MLMYMADFETVVEPNPNEQEKTCVWAWALSRLFDGTEDVIIGNSIKSFFRELGKNGRRHIVCYFHNLKFDASFIVDYLITKCKYVTAYNHKKKKFVENKEMCPGDMKYIITDLGIWYSVTVKYGKTLIEFRCSLKLLPFKVSEISKAFSTKYKKLEMDYVGHKGEGEVISMEERYYIRNDILVPKEALEKFLTEMHYEKCPPMTIGAAALMEFKKMFTAEQWELYFPNLAEMILDKNIYGSNNADEYIRRSYMGGWCYANENYTGTVNGRTVVCDVNSLYPSVMHSKSGNHYPIGKPTFFKEFEKIRDINEKNQYYFIRFRCKFALREGYLPFIQIKNDLDYRSNENLAYSWRTIHGRDNSKVAEMTLSKTTFLLFWAAYEVTDFKFLDGCYFETTIGLFDPYIDKYMRMKEEATRTGDKVRRTIAKLFLNSLYGKFGTSPENNFFIIEQDENDKEKINYVDEIGNDKKPVAVQIASAITSYARKFTVTAAILNSESFRYGDTDSCHLVLKEGEEPNGMVIDDKALLCWKIESVSDHSVFLRQKTYIEYGKKTDNEGIEYTDYDIKACGLPDRGKLLFEANLCGVKPKNGRLIFKGEDIKLMPEEKDFLEKKRTISSFKQGLSIPGKLMPKKIKGGCVLINDCFTIR